MSPFQPIVYPGQTKQYQGSIIQYVSIGHIDEMMMAGLIREWIEENHQDPSEELSPEIFAFDLSSGKIKGDDYIKPQLTDYAQSEYIDIEWIGILDEIYRPLDHHYIYHPWYFFHVSEG